MMTIGWMSACRKLELWGLSVALTPCSAQLTWWQWHRERGEFCLYLWMKERRRENKEEEEK
jgi:hypothetical protein